MSTVEPLHSTGDWEDNKLDLGSEKPVRRIKIMDPYRTEKIVIKKLKEREKQDTYLR